MNKLDNDYLALCKDILDSGVKKVDRTGTGTKSVFGRQIRHKMSDGFPALTTKRLYWKGVVTELLWFLRGETNIKYLVDNGCHIWDGDAYKAFEKWKQETDAKIRRENPAIDFQPLEYESKEEYINKIKTDDDFAEKWGELGPIYGKQWRCWNSKQFRSLNDGDLGYTYDDKPIDQIVNLISELKTNPDSRRLMVNSWRVDELKDMALPPCHYGFQVWTRELNWYDDLDKIKNIYVNWNLTKSLLMREHGGYAGDLKADTIESANQIFVDGWQNNKDPFTGKPLIELECFSSIPKRAISLMWNQRSVDTPLGLPFNIASYGLLLHIIAEIVNMVPDELIGNLGDTHIYNNQVDGILEQTSREPLPLPKLSINTEFWPTESGECGVGPLSSNIDNLIRNMNIDDFQLVGYKSHPAIKMPLSN